MEWHKVPDIQLDGQPFIKKVKVAGRILCLVGVEDKVYALAAKCPHAGGDLSNGWCKDGKLICPIHRYSYDITTGKGSEGQNDYIANYPVEIRDNGIYVGINSFWGKLKQLFR